MKYSDKVLDHFNNPRNVGTLDKNAKNVGTGIAASGDCGDLLKLQIKVDGEEKIVDARFKTFGCAAAIAASSLVTEWLQNKNIEQAGEIKNTQIAEELSLPDSKLHCSVLAEDAIRGAIDDWKKKQQ